MSMTMSKDTIYREDAIDAIECVTWYHQNKNKDMVSGANSDEHQAWYKADDVYKALEEVPSADRSQEDYNRGYCDAVQGIADEMVKQGKYIAQDSPQGWIPCSERLPSEFSDDEKVLATTDVDGLRVIIMFAYDVKSWYLKGYISAWLPLPPVYEGKGADDE